MYYKKLTFDEIHSLKIKKINPIIFDVGTNRGHSIIRFKKIFPDSIINAFEPIEKEFNNLKLKFEDDNTIILNNFALGEKEYEKDFYITVKTGNSSFNKLNLNTEWLKIRSDQYNTTLEGYTTEIKKTQINTLDIYCNKNNIKKIDILKIDTQGYEDKVLAGANEILSRKNIKIIETELILDDVYERHLSFYDIEKYLNKNNFRLIALRPMGFMNLFEGYMFAVDVIYLNEQC